MIFFLATFLFDTLTQYDGIGTLRDENNSKSCEWGIQTGAGKLPKKNQVIRS
jgi:hypothetical protein